MSTTSKCSTGCKGLFIGDNCPFCGEPGIKRSLRAGDSKTRSVIMYVREKRAVVIAKDVPRWVALLINDLLEAHNVDSEIVTEAGGELGEVITVL